MRLSLTLPLCAVCRTDKNSFNNELQSGKTFALKAEDKCLSVTKSQNARNHSKNVFNRICWWKIIAEVLIVIQDPAKNLGQRCSVNFSAQIMSWPRSLDLENLTSKFVLTPTASEGGKNLCSTFQNNWSTKFSFYCIKERSWSNCSLLCLVSTQICWVSQIFSRTNRAIRNKSIPWRLKKVQSCFHEQLAKNCHCYKQLNFSGCSWNRKTLCL